MLKTRPSVTMIEFLINQLVTIRRYEQITKIEILAITNNAKGNELIKLSEIKILSFKNF